MAEERSVVTRFRVEYNQAVQGLDAIAGSAQKTSREVEKAGTTLEQSARKQSDAAGRLRAAEAQLADAKRKNVEGSAQVVTAEEKVARARREVEASTEQATQAQRDYESALKRQQAQQDKTAQSASNAFQDMAKNAKANEQAWNQAGTVLTAVGGSIIALGVAATKSGIEFNSLNQTATGALTSVMGSAAGAARQMEKMNEFGRGTWVMRDSLIRAQQTMTGFGIETQKVIPYMDALAETVAATGGSNQDFEELARVMGKVNSSGKITAETFNEFGTRGVDAAQLIGDAMGMTAQEVRESVTEGTLDAGEALDALADGMKERFDGASDNIRQTFSGAFDNVAAAFRDLSASLAEPLVSKEGGGLMVDGFNALADSLNQLRDVSDQIPGPVKIAVGAISGIGAVASLAAGGFLLLAPRIVETQAAFKTLAGQDDLVGRVARDMGKLGPALKTVGKMAGIAGAALVAIQITNALFPRDDIKRADAYTKALEGVKGGSDEVIAAIERVGEWSGANDFLGTDNVNNFSDALDRVADPTRMDKINKGIGSLIGYEGSFAEMESKVSELDTALANMVDAGNASQAAEIFQAIAETNPDLPMERLVELMPDYISAAEDAGVASETAAGGVATLSAAAIEAQEKLDEAKDSLIDNAMSFADFADKSTDAEISLRSWIELMEDQVKAQEEWGDNLQKLVDRGAAPELMEHLYSLGVDGAFRVKQLADGSEDDLTRAGDAMSGLSEGAVTLSEAIYGIPEINLEADDETLLAQLWYAEERLRELDEMEPTPETDLKITALEDQIRVAKEQLGILDDEEAMPLVGVSGADDSRGKIEGVHEALLTTDQTDATPSVGVTGYEDAMGKITNLGDALSELDQGNNVGMGERIRRLWDRRLGKDEAYDRAAERAKKKASGGAIIGPGTGTSDDILTRLSNGEHVWTADEVAKAGGQAQVYRLRQMVRNGELQEMVPGFASGGAVGAAESRLRGAQRELDRLRKSKRKVTPEQARQDAREAQAQRRIDEAQAALERARSEQARRERVSAMQIDLSTDIRRGTIRDQVTGGLSGGYSVVDRLMKLAEDENLGRGARKTARSSAGRFESNLRRLYGQAERVEDKLKDAQEKARELEGISNAVASSVSRNAYSLDTSSQWSQNSAGQWEQTVGVKGARTNAAAAAARVKELAQKLKQLQGMGYGGAILQEVAQAGSIDESLAMANDLLQGSKSDVSSLNSSYSDIEKYSQQAGQYVTAGFYKGGVNAAQGVVKGLESQQKNIENQIAAIAKSMEAVFKQVLGIRSPSTVMQAAGRDTAEGARLGLIDSLPGIREAAGLIAQAATPDFGSMIAPVMRADVAPANGSVEDMSASTLSGLSEMRQAVSEGYLDMVGTTTEGQGVMNESTRVNQEAMTLSTQANHTQMSEVVSVEQAAMLNSMRENQAAMLENTRSQQNSMVDSTRTNFTSIRTAGTDETALLRSNVETTLKGMRGDHESHLSAMKTTNRTGFEEMERAGIQAFSGMRSGIGGEMVGARPELRSNLNELISVFDSFTKSVNEAFGDVGVKLSSPTRLYTGGVLPGHTPGRDIHHFRSPSAGDLYLSGGEAIMRPEFTRAVGGEKGVKELNYLARGGRFGDMNSALHTAMYASGGVLPPIRGVNAFADSGVWRSLFGAVKEKFPDVRLHSSYRPGSITATGNRSMHGQGKAVDITPRMDIANWIRENFGGGTRELIFSPMGNRQIHRGRNHFYTGITRAQHWDHIHWAMDQMLRGVMPFTGDGFYSGGMPTHPFLDKAGVSPGTDLTKSYRQAAQKQFSGIIDKHSKQLNGLNPVMGDLGEGVMRATREGLIKKAEEHAESMKFIMPGGEGVARWRDTVIQALGYAGLPQTEDYISAWLRQIKTESGGNPNIMQQIRDVNSGGNEAAGLVQVIPGTFAAFRDKSLPNDRFHPLANLVAGMNWAKYKADRQGRSMLSFIGHGHGYSQGTTGAPAGVALVGEDGPELVELGGGERIRSNPETRRFLEIQARPNNTATIDYDQLGRAIAKALPDQDIAAALNGAQMTLNVDGKAMTGFVHTAVASGYSESKGRLTRSSSKVGAR